MQEKNLAEAISVNSLRLVSEYLETGTDVNAKYYFPDVIPRNPFKQFDFSNDHKFSSGDNKLAEVSFLHQAVRNCYYTRKCSSKEIALRILRLIVESGGDLSRSCKFHVCNIDGYNWIPFSGSAMEFAVFLKKNVISSDFLVQDYSRILESSIEILMNANKKAGHLKPKTTPVLVTTFEGWCNLFADTDFADVKLVCADGETLQAHKVVLGVSSPYFKTLFLGPWKENDSNIIQIPESSSLVVSAFLKFMYTGQLDSKVLEENVRSLLGLSSQYMLPSLQMLCEQRCVTTLSLENIKDVLLLANLHKSNELKSSCFDFILRNTATVLTNPDMMSLSAEDPSLWAEMVAYIGGSSSSSSSSSGGEKRKR